MMNWVRVRCYFSIYRTPQKRVIVILRRYELPFVSGPGSAETSFFPKKPFTYKYYEYFFGGIRVFFCYIDKKKTRIII